MKAFDPSFHSRPCNLKVLRNISIRKLGALFVGVEEHDFPAGFDGQRHFFQPSLENVILKEEKNGVLADQHLQTSFIYDHQILV